MVKTEDGEALQKYSLFLTELGNLAKDLHLEHETTEAMQFSPPADRENYLKSAYPEVFTGLDKLEGYTAHVHVDPDITLVAQPPHCDRTITPSPPSPGQSHRHHHLQDSHTFTTTRTVTPSPPPPGQSHRHRRHQDNHTVTRTVTPSPPPGQSHLHHHHQDNHPVTTVTRTITPSPTSPGQSHLHHHQDIHTFTNITRTITPSPPSPGQSHLHQHLQDSQTFTTTRTVTPSPPPGQSHHHQDSHTVTTVTRTITPSSPSPGQSHLHHHQDNHTFTTTRTVTRSPPSPGQSHHHHRHQDNHTFTTTRTVTRSPPSPGQSHRHQRHQDNHTVTPQVFGAKRNERLTVRQRLKIRPNDIRQSPSPPHSLPGQDPQRPQCSRSAKTRLEFRDYCRQHFYMVARSLTCNAMEGICNQSESTTVALLLTNPKPKRRSSGLTSYHERDQDNETSQSRLTPSHLHLSTQISLDIAPSIEGLASHKLLNNRELCIKMPSTRSTTLAKRIKKLVATTKCTKQK
eukprot:XP_011673085.1 PREDICTED: bromodomain-containing protein 4B-like [Strongylocentrotus purpuratus]